jgi:1-acyl-sn-glycerol-3-phosphate acyltransferase
MRQAVNRHPFVELRAVLKPLVRAWLLGSGRLQIERTMSGHDPERMERHPFIVVSNHASRLDTVYLVAAFRCPLTVCGARPEYFRTPLRRLLMATGNILRVDGHEQFLEDCAELIRHGHHLLIYPEMGTHPQALGAFSPWAAEVALATSTPLVPCYLHGTGHPPAPRVRLVIGPPLRPEGNAEDLTGRMRSAILALASDPRTEAA